MAEIRSPKPLVVEVGVWKGASCAIFASALRRQSRGGRIVAVDTFLGALEMWDREAADSSRDLKLVGPTVPEFCAVRVDLTCP